METLNSAKEKKRKVQLTHLEPWTKADLSFKVKVEVATYSPFLSYIVVTGTLISHISVMYSNR